MNPYLATAIAMCAIVLISLAGTAYLAAMFNRRAKADMRARLDPLAAAIDGTACLFVTCSYALHYTFTGKWSQALHKGAERQSAL